MSLDSWTNDIIKNVYKKWKTNYSFWESGFKIFYGPVKPNPPLLIISYNPGGDKQYFEMEDLHRYQKGDFSPPTTNSYLIRDNFMAKRMKDFFAQDMTLLKNSVIIPILFFRSKNKSHWIKSFPKDDRKKIEKFCFGIVNEIIEKIQPKKILVIGFDTFEILQKEIFGSNIKSEIKFINYGTRKERLYLTSNWNGIQIFAIRHPTGARIRTKDWESIKEKFMTLHLQSQN